MMIKLANEYDHIISMASVELRTFMEKTLRFYMIENIFTLLEGARRGEDRQKLVRSINPLGRFESIESIIDF